MATVQVPITKLDLNTFGEISFESAAENDTIEFDYTPVGDEKLVMLFKGAGTITLKKGDSIQGVVDVSGEITDEAAVRIDSGLFKNVDGNDTDGATNAAKGKVVATVDDGNGVDVALIQLP